MKKPFSEMTEVEALASLGFRAAERDGKKGIEKDGLFIPALPEGECPGFIVGSPDRQDALKGSVDYVCMDCGGLVILSPSSQELLAQWPQTPVICGNCFLKREGIDV